MNYITENEIDKLTSDIGIALSQEPKVRIIVSASGPYWEGGINGHFFRIKTGQEVSVPKSLATLIAQSMQVTQLSEMAIKPFKGDGKKVG